VIDIRVQAADFDPGRQLGRLGELHSAALASFVGRIEAGDEVRELQIDHHASLAKAELMRMAEEAAERWSVGGIILIHRHGKISPNGRALFVGTAASEAAAANQACAWLVEQIGTRAPFWRKEILADGTERWP